MRPFADPLKPDVLLTQCLRRALALSIDEQHDRHAWKRPAAADPIVVPDDDENDEELNR